MASEDIIIRMGMDASAFNRGLQSAKVQGKQFQSSINGIGASIAAVGLGALTAKTIAYAGTISDLSTRLGVSASALQELGYAASLSGGTLEDVAAGLGKLAVASQSALDGGDAGEEMQAAFARLGVTMQELKTMRLEDLFRKIGAGVRDAADVQTVLSDATKILGKNSANVLAAMRNDLDAAAEEARRLGLIIGDDVIAKLDDLGDTADTLGKRLVSAFAPTLSFLAEIAHRVVDLGALLANVVAIPARIAGAMAGGASPLAALNQAFDETVAESDRVLAGYEARQRGRAARAAAPIAREESDASNSKMVKEADQILKMRERIAEAQAAELGNAASQRLIAEQVANLQKESANDGKTLAEGAARASKVAAKEEELKGLEGIAHADRRKVIEAEIAALKKEQSKANPEEVKALERQQKMLELKKKEKALEKEQTESRKKFVELRGERGTAINAATEARGERLKFTLGDLAGANLRNVSDPTLRKDILAAREVSRLESQAGFLKNRGGVGDLAEAANRLSMADKVRAGITSIRDTERFPFANMDANISSIDESIAALLAQANEKGLNVQAIMAK